MYCNKCGNQNDADAVYCQKCGRLLESEEETRVIQRSRDAVDTRNGVTTIVSTGPTLKFVKLGYLLTAIGAIVLVAILGAFTPLPIWIAVVVALLLFLIPAYFHLRQRLISYRLTDSTIEIDCGLASRTTRNIPLDRIQDVTVSSTMSQRLLGFGSIVIDNASETGGKVIIKNIDSPRKFADALMAQMRRLGQ